MGVIGGANSRMRLSSPITPPLVQDRKAGTLGKGRCLGELQIDFDYSEVSNYCSVAPLSSIAEEGGVTPTYVTTPVEPVATPVPPVLSLQNTHSHTLNRCGRHRAALTRCNGSIWLPTLPESHHVDVDSSEPSVRLRRIMPFFPSNYALFL